MPSWQSRRHQLSLSLRQLRRFRLFIRLYSDPVAAKLINQNNTPIQSNVTGLSSELPIEPQLDNIQKIAPNAKTIGYVYSPGEVNSVVVLNQLKKLRLRVGLRY